MDAGRELDALIALNVMGYTLDYEFADTFGAPTVRELRDQYDEWGMLPYYSTDMTDAWLVVDRLNAKLITVEIMALVSVANKITRYIVYSYNHETAMPREQALEHSAPLAICFVALKAFGVPIAADPA